MGLLAKEEKKKKYRLFVAFVSQSSIDSFVNPLEKNKKLRGI